MTNLRRTLPLCEPKSAGVPWTQRVLQRARTLSAGQIAVSGICDCDLFCIRGDLHLRFFFSFGDVWRYSLTINVLFSTSSPSEYHALANTVYLPPI